MSKSHRRRAQNWRSSTLIIMSIRSSLGSYEQRVLINNTFIPGVISFDASYQTSEAPVNAIGKGYAQSLIESPPAGAFSMTRNLIYTDPLINFTGDNPMKIRVVYPDGNNIGDASLDIKDAYMGEYSISCSVGDLPKISTTFDVYDDMGSTIFFDDNYIDPNFLNTSVWNNESVEINPDTNGFPAESPRGLAEATVIKFGDHSAGNSRIKANLSEVNLQDSFLLSFQVKPITSPAASILSVYLTGCEVGSKGRKDINLTQLTQGEWTKVSVELIRDQTDGTSANPYLNIEGTPDLKLSLFNFNFIKTQELEFSEEEVIPNMGSIHVSCDGSETNSVTNFNYSININRKPFYVIGDLQPKEIETIYPFAISADFTMELNDYQVRNMKDVFTGRRERDINIQIKGKQNTTNGEAVFPHITDTMSRSDSRPFNALLNGLTSKDSTNLFGDTNYGGRPIAITPSSPAKGFNVWRVFKEPNFANDRNFLVGVIGRSISSYFGFGTPYTFSTYAWVPSFMNANNSFQQMFAGQYDSSSLTTIEQILVRVGTPDVIDISDPSSLNPINNSDLEFWQRPSISFTPLAQYSNTHPDFFVIYSIDLPDTLDAYINLSALQIENSSRPSSLGEDTIFNLPVTNAELVGETFGGDSNDGSVVNLSYKGYINKPPSRCVSAGAEVESFKDIDWDAV